MAPRSGAGNNHKEGQTKKRKMSDEACEAPKDNTGHQEEKRPEEEPKKVAEDQHSTTLKANRGNDNDAEDGDGSRKTARDWANEFGMLFQRLIFNDFDVREEFRLSILSSYGLNKRATKRRFCWSVHEASDFVDYVFENMLGELNRRLLELREPCSKQLPLGRRAKDIIQRARDAAEEPGIPSHFARFYRDFISCLEQPVTTDGPPSRDWQRYRIVQQFHEYQLFDTHRQLVQQTRTSEVRNFLTGQGFTPDADENWKEVLDIYLNDKLQLRGKYSVGIICKKGQLFDSLVGEFGVGALGFLDSDSFEL